MPIFTDIVNQGRTAANKPGFDAVDWFREKAQATMGINTSRLVAGNKQYQTTKILPGHLYMFGYDAKMKDVLPFYDRFPVVFPFSRDAESFTGINLHYLPFPLRARLMDALYQIVTDQKFNEKTRLNLSYRMLASSSRYKYFEPCVKKYLYSHVQTKFLQVPSNEWDIALFLPLERFTVSKGKVYKDTMRKLS
jgi:hypothetical protein